MRLIDADTFNRFDYSSFDGALSEDAVQGMDTVLNAIDNAPTIDAVPVVHGEWINAYPDTEPNPMFMYGICSVCGFEQSLSDKLNYCPNCGAKMDGGNNSTPKKPNFANRDGSKDYD